MKVLAIWLRRGTGPFLSLAVFAFVLTSLLSQQGWRVELDWATRLSAGSLLLISPAVASAAAFDTSRRLRPTLAFLARGSIRPAMHLALPALAVVIWAALAFVVVWAVAAGIVVLNAGVGITDPWVFPEIIASLLGAGAVGLLSGMAVGNRWAAPMAAAVVFAGAIVAAPWGRGPFEVVTTYGTLTGLQRPPIRVLATLVGVGVVALAAVVAALEFRGPKRARRANLAACAVLGLLGAVVPVAWPWQQDVYEYTGEPFRCVGHRPAVCGPQSRLKLLRPVQKSLADAYRVLDGTPFVKPSAFRITRVDHYSDLNGAAPFDFDPAFVVDGHYDSGAVARALLRPRQCKALFDMTAAVPILDAQDKILPWLEAVLAGRTPARPVPPAVAQSFAVVENCAPMTGDRT